MNAVSVPISRIWVYVNGTGGRIGDVFDGLLGRPDRFGFRSGRLFGSFFLGDFVSVTLRVVPFCGVEKRGAHKSKKKNHTHASVTKAGSSF